MISRLLTLSALVQLTLSQNPSPCPEIFSYEPRGTAEDRWYGVLALKTSEDLYGVWIRIVLDRPAELLGNWFGEASSKNNVEYVIRNSDYKLEAGPPVSVRFFVKYNTAQTIPSVTSVRLNGKIICSAGRTTNTARPTESTLHITSQSGSNGSNGSRGNRPTERPTAIRNRDGNGEESRTRTGNPSTPRPSSSGNRDGNGEELRTRAGSPATPRPSNMRNPDGNSEELRTRIGSPSTPRPSSSGNRDRNGEEIRTRPSSPSTPRPSSSGSYSNGLQLGSVNADDGELEFFPGDFANIQGPAQNKLASRPLANYGRSPECGVVATRASPLITLGQETTAGQWPWHVALYHSRALQLVYTCGGTLISDQHILTAAHCVTRPQTNKQVNPSNILIYLGKHNLVTFGPEVQDRDVVKIYVHPEYDYRTYSNNIAVLKVSRPVEITNFVRPCCLWDEGSDLEDIVDRQGVVVGWGFDENRKVSSKLTQAHMPVVSSTTCIYSNREFFSRFLTEKSFCAGFRNGTSVCNGDSGGGMMFPRRGVSGQSTVWQIRGLVSLGVALQGRGICDTSQYVIFTDVAKHIPWIQQTFAN